MHHPGGVAVRLGVGRARLDGARIERDDIRKVAAGDAAAARESKRPCREVGEAMDRVLERNDLLVADIVAQEPRERAIRARMRMRTQEHALRRGRRFVRAEAHPRQRDLPTQVLLGCDEIARADPALVPDDEIDRRLLRRRPTRDRYLEKRAASERLEPLVLE